jgi:nitroreductase
LSILLAEIRYIIKNRVTVECSEKIAHGGAQLALHREGRRDAIVEFLDLLVKRRSVRDFQEKELPLESIREIIRDSCLAPSSGNGQPWKFVVVNRKEWMKRLSDESKKNILSFIEMNPGSPLKKYDAALRNPDFNVFYNAPCLIYIGCSKDVRSAHVDCALAAGYLMFSAAAKDLGTCWIALGSEIKDLALRREIGMSEDYQIIAPIILGYPKNIPATPMRNEPNILKLIT